MKFGTAIRNLKRKNPFVGGQDNVFSDIIYGPIIEVHSSNNLPWQPPTPECENVVKGGVARPLESRDPQKFWALNANSSKMAEDTNFKFCRRVPSDSPDVTTDKCFQKVGVVTVT